MATISGSGANASVTLAIIRAGTGFFQQDSSTTHSEIKAIQTALNLFGYYTGTPDGKYGSGTAFAVKGFQNENGLSVDAKIGKNTLAKLEALAGTIIDGNSTAPTLTRVQNGLAYYTTGHSGTYVNQIRTLLINKGYGCANSGDYDAALATYVRSFQTANGLSSDGSVGQATLAVLQDTSSSGSWLSSSGVVTLTAGKLAKAGFTKIALRPDMVTKLNAALNKYGINTKERVRHFLAQSMAEIAQGNTLTEYIYKPGEPASAYTASYGTYCGGGYIQLTWSANYTAFKNYMQTNQNVTDAKITAPAEYATQHVAIAYPCESAAWFWKVYKSLNATVDADGSASSICQSLTTSITGASGGSATRLGYYNKIASVLV